MSDQLYLANVSRDNKRINETSEEVLWLRMDLAELPGSPGHSSFPTRASTPARDDKTQGIKKPPKNRKHLAKKRLGLKDGKIIGKVEVQGEAINGNKLHLTTPICL